MTELRFLGEWGVVAPLAVSAAAAAGAWYLARRDTRGRPGAARWLLPLLRAVAVLLAALMLSGPVLHHRRLIGEMIRLKVVLDGSRSMGLCDPAMDPGRKLLIAHRLGWTEAGPLDTAPAQAADRLQRARDAVAGLEAPGREAEAGPAARAFAEAAAEAAAELGRARPATLKAMAPKGAILYERWDQVPGQAVRELTEHPSYRGKPSRSEWLTVFEARDDPASQYGDRLRGYLLPPATGEYTFWIAGDDNCELWLSSSEDPALKSRIARVQNWASYGNWEQEGEQKSRRIRLEGGQRYYVEVLHKEGEGESFVAVGWQMPDGTMERPIPGLRLAPFAAPLGGAPGAPGIDPVASFKSDIAEPAARLAAKDAAAARKEIVDGLATLSRASAAWERDLRAAFTRHASEVAESGDPAIRGVLERFDRTPRWQRVLSLLWEGRTPVLAELASAHDVELDLLRDRELVPLWRSRAGRLDDAAELPAVVRDAPAGRATDLAAALAGAQGPEKRGGAAADPKKEPDAQRLAVLLISDGAHNDGEPPVQQARVLGAQGVPVFAAGFGAERAPEDVALADLEAPTTIFHKDRVRGRVWIKDDLKPGRPFTVRIKAGDRVVWEKELKGEGTHLRSVPYDFPVEDLSRETEAPAEGVAVVRSGVGLDLEASVAAAEGDTEPGNDARAFRVFAVLQRYRALMIEGRPRWEWRYLRNLVERDEKWELRSVLASDTGLPRGNGPEQFPATREALFAFDLVILGDLAPSVFQPAEIEWIRDFAGDRGGGVMLIDGQRDGLRAWTQGPLGALLPVDWTDEKRAGFPASLRLTRAGARWAALDLASGGRPNEEVWSKLRAPHWVAPVRARAGAETLVEAVWPGANGAAAPALVHRAYGAGKVLYAAFDDTWRWRFDVADLHHARYWNQVALAMMEAPYAVKDKLVSLDADAPSYRPGERALIRARLRDHEGRALVNAQVTAVLMRNGTRLGALPMASDGAGGAYRAMSAPLEEGEYEVRLEVRGVPESDIRVKTSFRVLPLDRGELTDLGANEPLLRELASAGRGLYVREENLDEAVAALKPLSRGRIVESETVLWQSFGWFGVIVLLLTIEWIVRKREGML